MNIVLWFRRNLFWAVFGLAGLLSLAAGGWYLWRSVGLSAQADEEIGEAKRRLQTLLNATPSNTATNVAMARAARDQLEALIGRARKYITDIPFAKVQGVDFVPVLNSNVYYLHELARKHSVTLPDEHFEFSFEEQVNKARFASGTFPVMAEQLAEISLIATRLFEANIPALLKVKRSLTPDDADASPYCHKLPRVVKNEMGLVECPYEVTFYCFSTELARVLESLGNAEKFLLPKLVMLDHQVDMAKLRKEPLPGQPGVAPPPEGRSGVPGGRPGGPRRPGVPPRAPPPGRGGPPPPPSGSPEVPLNEQPCRVTLLVEVIKPAPPAPK